MAVCSLEGGLQPVNFYACNFIGKISYHDFEGITVRADEGARLVKNLGDNRILMLKNHGPVILGRSIPEIFIQHWALQRACEIQLATMAAGQPIVVGDDVIAVHHRDMYEAMIPGTLPGATDFAAWTRQIDRIDRSWRD
jgi:ribulose-5-phosphate 4-epimerase/fuculose-1-phosphate aldolase